MDLNRLPSGKFATHHPIKTVMQEMMHKAARIISHITEPLFRHEKSTRQGSIPWQSAAQTRFQHQLRAHWEVGEIEVTNSG